MNGQQGSAGPFTWSLVSLVSEIKEKQKKNKNKTKRRDERKSFPLYLYPFFFVLFSFSFSQCLILRRFARQPFKKLTTRKRRRLHLSPPLFFLFFIQRKQQNCNNKPTIIVDLLLTLFSTFIHKLEYVRSSFYCTSPAVFFDLIATRHTIF